jgi:poly-beta-1,6-N-acetyl-D-glucosamine synthase
MRSDGLMNIAKYFHLYPETLALASNVSIIPEKSFINLAQQFEYMKSYTTKRALTEYNIDYIVGGIGSCFKLKDLIEVGYYDHDTMTDDIDLTMKLINHFGNKNRKVSYASNVVTYAEAVPVFKDLVKQRIRWKFGRLQTLFKYKHLFFNGNIKYEKFLTFFYLPFEMISELIFQFQPFILFWFYYISLKYNDYVSFSFAILYHFFIVILAISVENELKFKDKIFFIVLSPLNYFVNFIVLMPGYIALIKSIIKLPNIESTISEKNSKWTPPTRTGAKS